MFNLHTIQSALQSIPEMHGWIFTNFSHRDELTDSILELNSESISSRRWVYIVPSNGNPIKIVHAIEKSILDTLPGSKEIYAGKNELDSILTAYSGKTFAILSDSNISVISTVDAGFVQSLNTLNIDTVTAAPLIQITKGLLSNSSIESHERAAALLYKIINDTWDFISKKYKNEEPLTEYDVLCFIFDKFNTYSLTYHHEPIVAFGKNAGDPHYSVSKNNSALAKKGDIIQLDIFAKEKSAKDANGVLSEDIPVYADISWVGIYDTEIPQNYNNTFKILCESRDIVYSTLVEKAEEKLLLSVSGCDLDLKVREILIANNYINAIKHRTGHGIDTECHGSGVNLDSVEFPDKRKLLNGSCFSVEPGLYFEDFGMRTEIDIYINDDKPIISGQLYSEKDSLPIPQKELLYIK